MTVPIPESSRSFAPRKRVRGKRRYFQRLHRKAAAFELPPGPEEHWDLWHHHVDWHGHGNRSLRLRLEHLRALGVVFDRIAAQSASPRQPFQLWLHVDVEDAGQDAVYLHTANPNGTPFPIELEAQEIGDAIDTRWLPRSRSFRFLKTARGSIAVFAPGIGLPLSPES